MESLFAVVVADLPRIIRASSDVKTVVNSLKAGDSAYQAIKNNFPKVSDAIDNLAKVFPKSPLIGDAEHLDNIAKALFAEFTWTPEQLAALAPYLPQNTGGGSLGYNQNLTPQ
jgi:ABC-type transporter Mla subunit MlaD